MKLALGLVVVLMTTTAALAEETVSADEACGAISSLAETIMTARQENFDMSEIMKMAPDMGEGEWKDIVRTMIMEAYDRPSFSADASKASMIMDFKNEVALSCYKKYKEWQ